jgi:hypothetical protein
MKDKILFFLSQIYLSKFDKLFISKYVFKSNKSNEEKKLRILFQMPEEYFYVVIFNKIIKNFNSIGKYKIDWIDINSGYQKIGKTYLLKKILPFGRKWKKLFTSNGGQIALKFDIFFLNKLKYIPKSIIIYRSLKEKQNGMCYWLNIPIDFTMKDRLRKPSLDRLDNSIGYRKDNVVLTTVFANTGRRDATVEEMLKFISDYL